MYVNVRDTDGHIAEHGNFTSVFDSREKYLTARPFWDLSGPSEWISSTPMFTHLNSHWLIDWINGSYVRFQNDIRLPLWGDAAVISAALKRRE